MNAITFILKEHQKIRNAFKNINKKSCSYARKKLMFNHLCRYLIRHESMEQTIWYPTFKNSRKVKAEVKHLLGDENHAEKIIKQFKTIKTQTEWEIKFAKFKKAVESHANEEEKKLFPNVKSILDKTELDNIGSKMQAFEKKHKLTPTKRKSKAAH